jgi:hypothetical protein
VEWSQLHHSHGSAVDTPVHLAALMGASEEAHEDALNYFWGYFIHQGTQCEACPYVVPYLFEALGSPNCVIRRELIDLLLGTAIGYGESFLPYGYDLKVEEQRFKEEAWRGLYTFEEARFSYHAVEALAEEFIPYVRPGTDGETRLSAAFAVAHFAQSLPSLNKEVAAYIRTESDLSQLQSLILCYGMLGRYAVGDADPEVIRDYLSPTFPPSIRVSAAIATTTILGQDTQEEAAQRLLTAVSNSWPLTSPRDDWRWWNEGDLLGYAAMVLQLLGPTRRDEVVRALCSALQSVSISTFALPETLLDILFPEPTPKQGRPISEMDSLQREALSVLLRSPHWTTWMISGRFLPSGLTGDDYRSALQDFLSAAGGPQVSAGGLLQRSGNVSSWDLEKHW